MNWPERIWHSSLGKKYIVALTGAAMVLFVIVHLMGNLQIFRGPEPLNSYANFLQSTPGTVWPTRIVLFIAVVLHVTASIKLSLENRAARPIAYEQARFPAASWASRTMLWTGLMVAAFIIYHLLHFTAEVKAINLTGHSFLEFYDPPGDPHGRHDVYKTMVIGFRVPWVSAFYILAMALLCLHIRHGFSAMFQSLGLKSPLNARVIDWSAWVLATMIFLGNCSIPVAILFGFGQDSISPNL